MTISHDPPLIRRHPAAVLSLYDTGLMVAQSLVDAGVTAVGFDPDPRLPAFHTRLCRTVQCGWPHDDEENVVECLIREARAFDRPAVIFPASDVFVRLIAKHREALAPHYLMNVSDHSLIERIVSKAEQAQLAAEAGLPQPYAFFPRDRSHLEAGSARLEFPAVIKPVHGFLWQQHFAIKAIRVDDGEALRDHLETIWGHGLEVIVQELIPGPPTENYEVSFYRDTRGAFTGIFVTHKLRQQSAFGYGTWVESAEDPGVRDLALRFARHHGLTGFANVEFKRDPRDGLFKFVEINPRVWQQINLARLCGIDFPLLQYRDLTGQATAALVDHRVGIKWIDPVGDLYSCMSAWGANGRALREWARSLWHSRSFGIFRWDDPAPALFQIDLPQKIGSLRRKVGQRFTERRAR